MFRDTNRGKNVRRVELKTTRLQGRTRLRRRHGVDRHRVKKQVGELVRLTTREFTLRSFEESGISPICSDSGLHIRVRGCILCETHPEVKTTDEV